MAATVAPKDDVDLVAADPDRSLHLWGHTPLCCRPDFTWGCCQHWQAAAGRKGCDWRAGNCKHSGLDCSREIPTSIEAECVLGRTAARSLLNISVFLKTRFWISAS